MRRALTLAIAFSFVASSACTGKQGDTPASTPAAAAGKPSDKADAKAPSDALLDPAKATEQAPDSYRVAFDTTKGKFVIEVQRAWAPLGADRFYNLVKLGFYDDAAFFRAIDGFMVQFGINGDPAVTRAWKPARIDDDPVTQSNTRGMISFATSGPNSRTTQVFISFGNNATLDGMGFSPFGKVVEGMEVVDGLYKGYGEGAPNGTGPAQPQIEGKGNEYLKRAFPKLDYVKTAVIEGG